MAFECGHMKSGGRLKGTPNRITKELRNVLRRIIHSEIESLPELIKSIKNPEKRVELVIKLLPFVVPKAQEISLEMLPDSKLDLILESLSDAEEGKDICN